MANEFNETVNSLFKGMNTMLTTKTVVGEPTHVGDTIILPLVDVNFGCAAGAFSKTASNSAGGGMGGKMSPSAVLVIQNGKAKMISVKNEDTIGKIMEMVPEIIDKISSMIGKDEKKELSDEELKEAIEDVVSEEIM